MLNVLACIYDFDLLKELMEQARTLHTLKLVALSGLPQDVKVIHALHIDVCLLECEEDQISLHEFVMRLRESQGEHLRIICLVHRRHPHPEGREKIHIPQLSCLYAPFQVNRILQELYKATQESHKSILSLDLERMVAEEIAALGIPIHLNGYQYIKTAVMILLRDSEGILSMKQLYKESARIHKTTVSRVEKAIRGAIDYAYRTDPKRIQIQGRRATNSQLIHMIYEQLRMRTHNEERVPIL